MVAVAGVVPGSEDAEASLRDVLAAALDANREPDRALAIARKADGVDGELGVHQHLGRLRLRLGAHETATYHHLLEAIVLAHQLEDECSATLARLRAEGYPHMALAEAEQPLKMYHEADDLEDQLRFLRTARWHLEHHVRSATG